jgi:hypothetical protein
MGITTTPPEASVLQFAAWQSAADESFWHRLASFKLNTQRLAEHPIPISGTDHDGITLSSQFLTLDTENVGWVEVKEKF